MKTNDKSTNNKEAEQLYLTSRFSLVVLTACRLNLFAVLLASEVVPDGDDRKANILTQARVIKTETFREECWAGKSSHSR